MHIGTGDRDRLARELSGQLESMGVESGGGGYDLSALVSAILRLQPALEFLSLLLTLVLAYNVAHWAAGRFEVSLPAARPFHLWRTWDEFIWVLVAALAVGLLLSGRIQDLALNVAVSALAVYAAQGLSLTRYYVRRLGIYWMLELMLYALLFLASGLGMLGLAGLGLLDTWFDWRRLRPSAADPDN